ncbi:hypothetical protein IV203_002756 [Nitzschia inconspicua]|uniref:Uncharacterized protein n=1 Tax=Nitzschia inconspicua TaxID=303405 RepID=A0A9K3L287_9STRA|nr:hypothetical protein IV203_002756 [Nitzschia inconspicua]
MHCTPNSSLCACTVTEMFCNERTMRTFKEESYYEMAASVRPIENHFMGEPSQPPASKPTPAATKFTVSCKGLTMSPHQPLCTFLTWPREN